MDVALVLARLLLAELAVAGPYRVRMGFGGF
jgi:hypothetical protein